MTPPRVLPRMAIGVVSGIAVALLACTKADGTVPAAAAGEFHVAWRDTLGSGSFEAPAVADWCETRQELLVTAQRGDTGVAVLYVFGGPQAPGTLPLRSDGATPRGGVVLRTADRALLRAWRGDSGSVTLESTGAAAAGKFGVRALTAQEDHLGLTRMTGSFSGAPVRADTSCTPR